MAEHVEGQWKNFIFRMVQPEDFSDILIHLRANFYRDEPLCRAAGYDDDMASDVDEYIMEVLKTSDLNFLALDSTTKKIAGVRISTVIKKINHEDKMDRSKFRSDKTWKMFDVAEKLADEGKIFQKYPDIDQCVEFVLVTVDQEYRGFGLATEIYDRSVKMLTAMKFPLIKCLFSSPYTEKIARKRGWIEIGKIKYVDCKENGKCHFPNAGEDEQAILMVKELN